MVTPDPDYDISPLNSLDDADNPSNGKLKIQPEPVPSRESTDVPTKSSSMAIKIGEYADRKEPCKLHFISKFDSNEGNGDVTSQLKNELEKTLSKLNIQNKRVSFMGLYACIYAIVSIICSITGKRRDCGGVKRSRTLSKRNSDSKVNIECGEDNSVAYHPESNELQN